MCKEGYQLRGISDCIDINECIYNDPCDQKCMNTEGSYRCSCSGGFILAGKHNCKDVDECLNGGHTCQQNCDNTVGSFSCYCNSGFVLATNGRNCEGELFIITGVFISEDSQMYTCQLEGFLK
jgi:hypothetical protein